MNSKLSIRVSDKGAVSVYGLRRFPITLYESEWRQILERKEVILQFLKRHEDELAKERLNKEKGGTVEL